MNMKSPEVLIIEDDEQLRRVLRTALAAECLAVQEASTVTAGVLLATQRFFDAIILDLDLSDGHGIDVIKKVRQAKQSLPIIVLSLCSNESDKIAALDVGADDFLNKPVAIGELLARLRAALRRSQAVGRTPLSIYRTGEVEVDLNNRRIDIAGTEVHLTRIEYKLLEVLIRHADQIVTHGRLLRDVWGTDHAAQIHYLRIYMLQLRRKLEADPSRPRYLLTEPGLGYRLATRHFPEAWKTNHRASGLGRS
jgi:two-component system, OmpR family, KDP operon response regulator KdpE